MPTALDQLVGSWNTLNILRGFLGFLKRRLESIKGTSEEKSVGSLEEVGEAFAEGWLGLGSLVKVSGRISRFAPIYFPIAYSPQVPGVLLGGGIAMRTVVLPNPAPGSVGLRHVDDGILAFLFPAEAAETPRITSPVHLDRLSTESQPLPLPYSSAAPSIPILLDLQQQQHLEEIVAVCGRIRALDPGIQSEIEASSETFVKLYYHGFFRSDWFPDQGFMLDARTSQGGSVRTVGEPSPFMVSNAIELGFESTVGSDELEDVLNVALDRLVLPEIDNGATGSRSNYRPAYHTPGGYEVKQVNRLPVVTHMAFEKKALQISVVSYSSGDLSSLPRLFEQLGIEVLGEFRRRDPNAEFKPLFGSDPRLLSRMGL